MTPTQYANLKNKSQRQQEALLALVPNVLQEEASNLLYKIIENELELEAECNK